MHGGGKGHTTAPCGLFCSRALLLRPKVETLKWFHYPWQSCGRTASSALRIMTQHSQNQIGHFPASGRNRFARRASAAGGCLPPQGSCLAQVEEQLLKGAEQAGDTILPRVVICQRLGQMLDWLDDTADARDFRGGTADGDAVFSPREIISGRGSESNFPAVCSESALPAEKQLRVVAHPVGCRASMASMLTGEEGGAKSPQQAPIMVAVGPEGGWTEEELTLLGTRGFTAFSLGERTLTTTEACIALLALAVDAVSSRPPKEYRQ
mmetsp:Transcript_17386/g.41542  ORF Transcript_17386/g.41542 Transcript_17386/m.41542 type:complete len:266 (+) Transcript_17386:771-1568(+)